MVNVITNMQVIFRGYMSIKFVQMNTSITLEDKTLLDQMCREDYFLSCSAFVRKLIRQEWERRHQAVKLISDSSDDSQDMNSLSD